MQELAAYRNGLLSALEGVIPELSSLVEAFPSRVWQVSEKARCTYPPLYPGSNVPRLMFILLVPCCGKYGLKYTPLLPLFDYKVWMQPLPVRKASSRAP